MPPDGRILGSCFPFLLLLLLLHLLDLRNVHEFTEQFLILLLYKPALDSEPGVCKVFPHIILHALRPHALVALCHKLSDSDLPLLYRVCANSLDAGLQSLLEPVGMGSAGRL